MGDTTTEGALEASTINDDDDTIAVEMRQRLMVAESVFLYKIPPLKSAGGHRAEDWNLAHPLAVCRLLVERRGDTLVLEFTKEDSGSGSNSSSNIAPPIFAKAVVDCSVRAPTSEDDAANTTPLHQRKVQHWLEGTVDSSRYFTLRILAPNGRDEALIGFGFRDRDPAIDLRESMQHYESSMRREAEAMATVAAATAASSNDPDQTSSSLNSNPLFTIPKLAAGEKIHINLGKDTPTKLKKSADPTASQANSSGSSNRPMLLLKKPPPSAEASLGETSLTTSTTSSTLPLPSLPSSTTTDSTGGTTKTTQAVPHENDTKTTATEEEDDDEDWEAEFVSAVKLDDDVKGATNEAPEAAP